MVDRSSPRLLWHGDAIQETPNRVREQVLAGLATRSTYQYELHFPPHVFVAELLEPSKGQASSEFILLVRDGLSRDIDFPDR